MCLLHVVVCCLRLNTMHAKTKNKLLNRTAIYIIEICYYVGIYYILKRYKLLYGLDRYYNIILDTRCKMCKHVVVLFSFDVVVHPIHPETVKNNTNYIKSRNAFDEQYVI